MEYTKNIVSDRFNALLAALNLNVPELARQLGYERSDKLYNISKGKYLPSFEIMCDITKKFVSVNINWLLTGNGDMFCNNRKEETRTLNSMSISPSEEPFIYKMYQDEKAEKERMLKEKDSKIDHLNEELSKTREELTTIKVQYAEYKTFSEELIRQLEAGAPGGKTIAKRVSTKKHSSPNADDVSSVIVP